jgi:hypothetical protein
MYEARLSRSSKTVKADNSEVRSGSRMALHSCVGLERSSVDDELGEVVLGDGGDGISGIKTSLNGLQIPSASLSGDSDLPIFNVIVVFGAVLSIGFRASFSSFEMSSGEPLTNPLERSLSGELDVSL